MKRCPLCDTDYPNHHLTCDRDGAMLIASRELEPGTVVRNKYRIVRTLGRGGMGTVYLADHILLGRPRALKFISSELSEDPKLLKRFRLEALAAIELRHPNVAEVVDLDQAEDGSPFIAMDFVQGRDLRHAMSSGPMEVERSLRIIRGVALGLGAAHAKGIIHRDVKPENILLATGPGQVETPKLLDFGIAAITGNLTASNGTRTGLMLTPAYAPPEQWMGLPSDQMDGRADLYALGGVLNEMLTGQTCFHSKDAQGWQYQHGYAERRSPSQVRAELSSWPGLDAMVLRLLAPEREDRPRDVAEFLLELDAVRAKRPEPHPHTLLERKPGARRKTVAFPEREAMPPKSSAGKSVAWHWSTVAAGCLLAGGLVWVGTKKFGIVPELSQSAGALRENSKDGLKYARIPPGSFEMGCSAGDTECKENEKPPHVVSISRGFWMGQTPVTVRAWKRYRAATNAPALLTSDTLGRTHLNEAGPEDMPVISESWEQASSFCHWAGMTLPTEAQWEYAARAGTRGARYGDLDAIAWYGNNSGLQPIDAADWSSPAGRKGQDYEQGLQENGNFTHPVGQKQPNAWQLFDMLGNVLEWTNDWYDAKYYQSGSQRDPAGVATGQTKVVRGGSWGNIAEKVRVSSRTTIDPDRHFTGIGFRCAGDF